MMHPEIVEHGSWLPASTRSSRAVGPFEDGGSIMPALLQALDLSTADSVLARARLDGAFQVGERGLQNLGKLASEGNRLTMECPTMVGDVQHLLHQYMGVAEAAMLRTALGR